MPRLASLRLVAPLLAVSLASPARGSESSLRCDGGIVSVGDSKLDLLAKCGAPSLAERSGDAVAVLQGGVGLERHLFVNAEHWTYDFGRNRFIYVVTLVRGKVTAFERGGYGYAEGRASRERPRKATCDPALLSEGKLKLEVLSACGEPALLDAWQEELRTVPVVDGPSVHGEAVVVAHELWTYDFGPHRLLRFVRFEDGRVTRVETGSYGYGE